MFQFNLKNHSSHFYPNVQEAYKAYLELFVTESDYAYYKECCGLNLNDITNPKIMECIFVNVFEDVVFSGYVNRVLTSE